MAEPVRTEFSSLPEVADDRVRPVEAPVKLTGKETAEQELEGARAALARFAWSVERSFSVALVRARSRLRYLKTERPLELVAAVAAAAFLAGAALRIWRSSRE